jgi:hypothetical protein
MRLRQQKAQMMQQAQAQNGLGGMNPAMAAHGGHMDMGTGGNMNMAMNMPGAQGGNMGMGPNPSQSGTHAGMGMQPGMGGGGGGSMNSMAAGMSMNGGMPGLGGMPPLHSQGSFGAGPASSPSLHQGMQDPLRPPSAASNFGQPQHLGHGHGPSPTPAPKLP